MMRGVRAPRPARRPRVAVLTRIRPSQERWTAKTDCKAGYVVRNCKQFKGAKAAEAVDPYTL
jgi:hypothetical protein